MLSLKLLFTVFAILIILVSITHCAVQALTKCKVIVGKNFQDSRRPYKHSNNRDRRHKF
jgi:hypothetical protein